MTVSAVADMIVWSSCGDDKQWVTQVNKSHLGDIWTFSLSGFRSELLLEDVQPIHMVALRHRAEVMVLTMRNTLMQVSLSTGGHRSRVTY